MFKELRNRIITITMTITTAILLAAGGSVMLFSSATRPEPKPASNLTIINIQDSDHSSEYELQEFIKNDRQEGNSRLLITLLSVGAIVEIIVFLISYYLSEKIIAPVQDSYDKQKIFIANASHELKTPLAVIEANMEALEVDEKNELWKTNIETEITHANKLVLDLLQLARMDSGRLSKTPPERLNLSAIIKEQTSLFQPKFSGQITFRKKTQDIECSLHKQDFLQVLDILLDNATKYGDKKILITLDQKELTITNDGTVIAPENLEKIFDRFYQTDKTKSGSGLGLAIAKAICAQNGWQLSCNSDAKTTSFTVRF